MTVAKKHELHKYFIGRKNNLMLLLLLSYHKFVIIQKNTLFNINKKNNFR